MKTSPVKWQANYPGCCRPPLWFSSVELFYLQSVRHRHERSVVFYETTLTTGNTEPAPSNTRFALVFHLPHMHGEDLDLDVSRVRGTYTLLTDTNRANKPGRSHRITPPREISSSALLQDISRGKRDETRRHCRYREGDYPIMLKTRSIAITAVQPMQKTTMYRSWH